MHLDMDCVRDILLCVEDNTGLRKYCVFFDASPYGERAFESLGLDPEDSPIDPYQTALLEKYDNDKLLYHLHYCAKADLIEISEDSHDVKCTVLDLTPFGHDLIGKIRDQKNWGVVKKGLSSVRSYSLDVIKALSEGLAFAGVKSFVQSLSL